MKLPLKTRSMKFMLFIAISSLFLTPASAEDVLENQAQTIEALESEVRELEEFLLYKEDEDLKLYKEKFREFKKNHLKEIIRTSKNQVMFREALEELESLRKEELEDLKLYKEKFREFRKNHLKEIIRTSKNQVMFREALEELESLRKEELEDLKLYNEEIRRFKFNRKVIKRLNH